MDIFDIHNIKSDKNNTMQHYQQFKKITQLFRFLELFLAVVLLSWTSTRLPLVLSLSSSYFRYLFSVIVSPFFIFLISNLIVLTLVLKSRQLTGNISIGYDLYEDIVNNDNDNIIIPQNVFLQQEKQQQMEDIVYEDKEIISEVINNNKGIKEFDVIGCGNNEMGVKVYRRSKSENIMKNECCGKLKRSETEMGRRKEDATVEKTVVNVVDQLSNEEFQRRIEGFIAKQVRFHQEEKLSIVLHDNIINNIVM